MVSIKNLEVSLETLYFVFCCILYFVFCLFGNYFAGSFLFSLMNGPRTRDDIMHMACRHDFQPFCETTKQTKSLLTCQCI